MSFVLNSKDALFKQSMVFLWVVYLPQVDAGRLLYINLLSCWTRQKVGLFFPAGGILIELLYLVKSLIIIIIVIFAKWL